MTKSNFILYFLTAMATFMSSSGFDARQLPPAPKSQIETDTLDASITIAENKIKRLEQKIRLEKNQRKKDLDTIRVMEHLIK